MTRAERLYYKIQERGYVLVNSEQDLDTAIVYIKDALTGLRLADASIESAKDVIEAVRDLKDRVGSMVTENYKAERAQEKLLPLRS